MRIDLSVCGTDGDERDVAVLAASAAPFADVAAALASLVGPVPQWCSGGRPVPATARLGGPGLRTGDRLTTEVGPCEHRRRQVEVVGGVDAGRCLRGSHRIAVVGRDAECELRLDDPDVSRRHARLRFRSGTTLVSDLGSTHGTSVGTAPVTAEAPWQPGAWLRVGDSHLALPGPGDAPAGGHAIGDGTIAISPRRRASASPPQVLDRPTPRGSPARAAAGWTAVALPTLGGAGLALWTGSLAMLAMALVVPLVLLAGIAATRLRDRRATGRARSERAAAVACSDAAIDAALAAETAQRRRRHPDAPTIEAIARGRSARLWERTRDDPDLLEVRVGLGDEPSATQVRGDGGTEPAGTLRAVPAVLDLAAGSVGLVGPRAQARAAARWLVAQLATLTSPSDVRIEIRTDDPSAWAWSRWLPHLGEHGDRPAATVVVHDSPQAGELGTVTAICLAETPAQLPAQCSQIVTTANHCGTRLDVDGRIVLTDAVGAAWAERVARALAPLAPAGGGGAGVPSTCRLTDVLGAAEPAEVARRWSVSTGGATAPVGLDAAGPVPLDLDRDGPHVLVAGTTGAGKSELLRTLVVALACSYPPDELGFVLIDYKGGAAFAECASLPHVTGLVTDLDEYLTARALASLQAELRRRERLLAAAGAPDLRAYRATGAEPAVARLLIVVDEYATLAAELPDFVAGLTGVAQRGRSLGLHLVLATQRPAGVVTAAVRANCSLRIALRVTDPADSRDVLDGPQAAEIPNDLPGRAYVWADGTARPVQIARTDLAYRTGTGVIVRLLGPGRTLPSDAAETGASELAAFVAAAGAAAGDRRPARPPWLPPLPERICLDAVPVPTDRATIAFGLVDLPAQQSRRPLALDLDAGGCVLLAGARHSGRSTALVTVAIAAARRYPPDGLHIHAIDLAGTLVGRLTSLPHRGTLASPVEGLEVVDALIDELAAGTDDARELILLDNWEALARAGEEAGGHSTDRLLSLIRNGRRGRTFVVTGDRSVLSARLSGLATTRLLLRLPDRSDFAMAGVAPSLVPTVMPPGRVLLAPDGTEAHLATTDVASAVAECARRWPYDGTAVRLRPLPRTVAIDQLPPTGDVVPFAVAAPYGEPVTLPLASCLTLLVAGPARSGRTTVLTTLLHQALRAGLSTAVAANARSPLAVSAVERGVPVLDPAGRAAAAEAAVLLVDDADDFGDGPAADLLMHRATLARTLVVAARTEDVPRTFRGVVAQARRSRCALLLQPGLLDGELVGLRLTAVQTGGPPGRGVLLGDPSWGPVFERGPVRVQVARSA